MDTSVIDQIITGRLHPHIYAFRTGTIPDYLKVGDTYRPVEVRLAEWRNYYKALEEVYREEASVDRDVFFRDYAVHHYLEDVLSLHRLSREDIPEEVYYSNEFFQSATKENVESAIKDIRDNYFQEGTRYRYYRFDESRIPVEKHYPRSCKALEPREEQEDTVKRFINAKKQGRNNLLMYAVMRFGKSFTAMLCAKEIGAKLVVVICGKTAVEDEWRRNVEIPKNFEEYSFKTRDDLDNNVSLISEAKEKGERLVVFLTLQDLAGEDIKQRHKELFDTDIDLVIIDETHFGARAPEYGKVLQDEFGFKGASSRKEYQEEEDIEAVSEVLKYFKTDTKLHLSGTPYRILMGSEFEPEDVVAFYQLTDIVDSQERWNNSPKNLDKKEWENPYYGFPQMVRFAFNPSDSARRLIKDMKEKGRTCALSALFEPNSVIKDASCQYRYFKHEKEILELLEVIDGSREDDELLGFLDYGKIKEGQMCRHIVCVLPFRASCDAFQTLVENNRDLFKNLSGYEILNIAGHDCPRNLKTPAGVKDAITRHEEAGHKTITLTVNKMLTGSTVECWDTMLFFKDTSSPQEYDQAIFRIQNPYVKTMKDSDGDEIKFNMKPQTLLVDFDVDRLFRLQALKSQIYDANIGDSGNAKLELRMLRELTISPVIVLNKSLLKKVEPADIMAAISEYSKNRSVADEAKDIPVDMRLFDDPIIRFEIDRQAAISSKDGLSTKPNTGSGDDIKPDIFSDVELQEVDDGETPKDEKKKEKESPEELFKKRFATYYSRILFFTFLSKDRITNLDELISLMYEGEDNSRIAHNLDLSRDVLVHLRKVMDGNKLGALEFKMLNLNRLEKDGELSPLDRARTALRRFSRLSESEITTPPNIASDMVNLLPDDCSSAMLFLDIASKQGEFAIALVERFGEEVKQNIWSLPTSGAAYEFTRKVYEFLEMPVDHIFCDFTAYDLIGENKEEYIDILTDMNFDVIVGNPPYQSTKATERSGVNKAFSSAIYPSYVDIGRSMVSKYMTMIIPSRWMTGTGQGITDVWVSELINCNHFIDIRDFYDSTECFKEVELKGGVNYFLYSNSYSGECNYVLHQAGKTYNNKGLLNALGIGIVVRDPQASNVLKKIIDVEGDSYNEERSFSKLVGPQHFFDKDGKLTTRWKGYSLDKDKDYSIKYYLNKQVESQGYAWIKEIDVPKNEEVVSYHKVFLSKAFNGGDAIPHQIIGRAFYGEPGSLCSQTYLVIGWNQKQKKLTETECKNIISYMNTRFFRYLVFIKKKTQDNPTSVFQYVPIQNWSEPWTDAKLYKKYNLTKEEIAYIESTIKPM